jgi:hypothetical protein
LSRPLASSPDATSCAAFSSCALTRFPPFARTRHASDAGAIAQGNTRKASVIVAQKENNYDMQGHAVHVQLLLTQASQELKVCASLADAPQKK